MKKSIVALSVLFSSLAISAEKKEFVIGVENINYTPAYTWDGKNYGGYMKEFLEEFAKKKGYKFIYKAMPIARLFDEFVNKDILDVKCPDNAYWAGDMKAGKTIHYSKPIIKNYDGVFVKPENKGKGLDHLKKLGTVMGFTAFAFLDLIKSGKVALLENANYEGLMQQAIAGRNDGAYAGSVAGLYQLKEIIKNPNALVFDTGLPFSESFYSCSSKKFPQLIKEMDEYMVSDAAAVAELKKKHNVIEPEYKK